MADKLFEGVEVDRELPVTSVRPGKDFVIDWLPVGKFAQVIDNALGIGPEIMRAVIVHEYPGFVVMIVSVAGNVITALDHEAALAHLASDPFR